MTDVAADRQPPTSRRAERDLLRLPGLGRLLLGRRLLQGLCLAGAAVIVMHGLLGPQRAPKNLATLTIWVHYRGLLLLGLLVLGNVFCLACPFQLARDGVRRLLTPALSWPRRLRGKGVGIALLVAVLFGYELWDWWASPRATAWLVLGYFAAAVLVDGLFTGASFCKSVCPIGQFNFAASSLSPFELRPRDARICDGCSGHECLAGAPAVPATAVTPARSAARGCEMGLFLPAKAGNMDCTLCLDCVRACPEDNVALVSRPPALELVDDRSGAGVGRLEGRRDLSLLAVAFTFGALANAFGMVSPVYAFQQWLADLLGTRSEGVVLGVLFGLLLVVEPVALMGLGAWVTRRVAGGRDPLVAVAARHARGLVPLGVGVWAAHYGFHFLTGLWTVVPVAQSAVRDALGVALLGAPAWGLSGLSERAVQPIETGLLVLGAAGSLMVLWHQARREAPARPAAAFAPWAVLVLALLAAALWLMAQPMEMRGTFLS